MPIRDPVKVFGIQIVNVEKRLRGWRYAFSAFDIVIKSESDKNIDFLYGFCKLSQDGSVVSPDMCFASEAVSTTRIIGVSAIREAAMAKDR